MGKMAVADQYKLGVGAAGVLLLLLVTPGRVVLAWPSAVFFLLIAGIAEFVFIPLPSGVRITVGFAVTLPCFLLYGPVVAAWVTTVGIFAAGTVQRRPFGINLFNGGQYALAALGAGWAFVWAAGPAGLWPAAQLISARLGYVMVYVATFFVINHLLVNTYASLRHGYRPANVLENMKWDGYNYLLSVPLGLLLTFFYMNLGRLGASMVFAPVLTVAYILRLQLSLTAAHRELTLLQAATRQINSALDLERVFELTSAPLKELVGSQSCALYLWDPHGSRLTRKLVDPPELAGLLPEVADSGAGTLGRLVRERQPAIISELGPGWAPEVTGMQSWMAVPLPVEDRLVGLMLAASPAAAAFSEGNLRAFTTLANHAAVAMENALLYHKTELLAITDPLTELFNYRYLYLKLGEEIRKSRLTGRGFALIYLDLNDFSRYNNLYGHLAGDFLLAQFSEFLRRHIRSSDIAARYAGDEFLIILPGAGRTEAEQVATRLLEALDTTEFAVGSTGVFVTLSMGAGTACFPEDGDSESALIHAADQIMYSHKARSRRMLPNGHPAGTRVG